MAFNLSKTGTRWLKSLACILIIAGLSSLQLLAQKGASPGDWNNLFVERLSIEQGLSQVTVLALLQDKRGFIWMGTQNGLNRYDGYNMTVYTNQPDDSLSIGGNFIYALYEDRRGNIWIGTRDNGVSCFDPITETFRQYAHNPDDPNSLSDNFVDAIFEDSKGTIWIGTWNGGLNALKPQTGQITSYPANPDQQEGLSHKTVTSITEDKSGNLWIATFGGGICRLDTARKKFQRFTHLADDANSLGHNRVISLYKDPSEKEEIIWVGTIDGGLNRFEVSSQRFKIYKKQADNPYSLQANRVHGLCLDPSNSRYLWVGTWENGLSLFDKKTEQFKLFGYDTANPKAISSDMLFQIIADRSGNLWVGSQGGGVNKIDPNKQIFEHWHKQAPKNQRLEGNQIIAIYEERSGRGIWISTEEGGLHFISHQTGQREYYAKLPGTNIDLLKYPVSCILEDAKGNLWVGLGGHSVHWRKPGALQFQQFPLLNQANDAGAKIDVRSLHEDKSGQIWVGTLNKGIFLINPSGNTVKHFENTPANKNSLSSNDILTIGEDAAGNIFIGTRGSGLNKFDKNTGRFIIYKHDPENPHSLTNNSVNAIHQSAKHPGLILLATAGGICLFDLNQTHKDDPLQAVFTRIRQKERLLDQTVYGILEDQQGRFWASTTKGLVVLELEDTGKEFQMRVSQHFDKTDGLQSNEFNLGASFVNKRGELFFGGVNGLNVIRPNLIGIEKTDMPLVFTRFEKYNETNSSKGAIAIPGISHRKQITLAYNENIFYVEFAALNFKNTSKNKYAYQLEGESDNWITLGERRRLTFANLAPGKYTLRIKSAYHDGPWNKQIASLQITIRPPWWRSTLAWIIYGFLLVGGSYKLIRHERKRLQTKNELKLQAGLAAQLKELDKMKSKFFANISHEFRTPLTLILGPLEQLMGGKFQGSAQQEYALMKSNALRLQKLIDQLLDLSRLDAGKYEIHKRNGDMVSFIRSILSAFQPLAESRHIRLDFETEVPSKNLDFDQELMENILFNLLSNAFKFTPAHGRIWVSLSNADHHSNNTISPLSLKVSDTGKGISEEHLPFIFDRFYKANQLGFEGGTGIGLALVKELVSLHGGEITVASKPGKGAVFQILLPIENIAAKTGQEDWTPGINPELQAMPSALENEEKTPQKTNENTPLVLVVEDNTEMRQYIERQLVDSFQIITAQNGLEGLKMAQHHIPDLIICDLMMPEMNGNELCKKLKNDEYTSHIPLILLTAKASGGSRIEGLQAGADDYMIKPFNVKELLARSNNLIAQRKQLRKLLGSAIKENSGDAVISKADAMLMEKLLSIIHESISDENFDVDQLARKAGFSRAQLYRKIKALTDQSVSEYIQMIRLKRAAELILQQSGTLTEVAYMVGFKDPSYFSKCFRKQFDCLPSEYLTRFASHK